MALHRWLFGGEGTADMLPFTAFVAGCDRRSTHWRGDRQGGRFRRRRPSGSGLRVLVMDRAADTRVALSRLLGAEGYDVHAVDTARRARRLARLTRFDLLITDLGTPEQPELSLLRDLRVTVDGRAAPRGIVVTAMQPEDYGGEDVLERAGYEAVLLKPIRFDELLSLVQRVTAGATR